VISRTRVVTPEAIPLSDEHSPLGTLSAPVLIVQPASPVSIAASVVAAPVSGSIRESIGFVATPEGSPERVDPAPPRSAAVRAYLWLCVSISDRSLCLFAAWAWWIPSCAMDRGKI
jgi:hypothetical protein